MWARYARWPGVLPHFCCLAKKLPYSGCEDWVPADVSTQMMTCFRLQGLRKAWLREQCESRPSKVARNAVATKAKEEQPLNQEVPIDTPGARRLAPEQVKQDKQWKYTICTHPLSWKPENYLQTQKSLGANNMHNSKSQLPTLVWATERGPRWWICSEKTPTCHAGKSWQRWFHCSNGQL